MEIHGVDEDEYLQKGSQKFLYESIKDSDKTLCF